MVFYATAEGVIFEPFSEEAERAEHDSKDARERLSHKFAARRDAAAAEEPHEQDDGWEDEEEKKSDAPESSSTELIDIRRHEHQLLKANLNAKLQQQQRATNKILGRQMARTKGNSKAIASNFVHKEKAADNPAARAIVHHAGSHYHMAGSRQFQRGVRVKGVISRHSKQGAKLQSARVAGKNMFAAREDAKGQRSEGTGKSLGKSSKKKGKKSEKAAK